MQSGCCHLSKTTLSGFHFNAHRQIGCSKSSLLLTHSTTGIVGVHCPPRVTYDSSLLYVRSFVIGHDKKCARLNIQLSVSYLHDTSPNKSSQLHKHPHINLALISLLFPSPSHITENVRTGTSAT